MSLLSNRSTKTIEGRERTIVFFLVSTGVFTLTFGLLYLIDFLPETPSESATLESESALEVEADPLTSGEEEASTPQEPVSPLPIRIIIDKLDKDITVQNPESRSVADLDNALLSGVVRHPDSADFEREGTIFLFGHSSYLPHVINKNFQAFNGIQELRWGDRIRLQSEDMEYVYRVDRVYEAKASDAEVEIIEGEPKLTLATCNSFGSKDDRYVVESTLVDSYPIQ